MVVNLLKRYLFGVLILFALGLRLWLSPLIFNGDLLSQAGWGNYVANAGPKNLYSYNVWTFSWPNHPPLTSLYYGFCFDLFREVSLRLHQSVLLLHKFGIYEGSYFIFVDSFDRIPSAEAPYSLGYLICLKLMPILADIIIGLIVFVLARKKDRNGYIYSGLYLLLPFSWYISALWGQTDQLAFMFVLLAFLIVKKYPYMAIILYFIGGSIKPTSIFLVPLFVFLLYKLRVRYWVVAMGLLTCVVLNYFILQSFTDSNLIKFTFEQLLPRLFDKPPRLTTNSFNFWHIFTLNKNVSNEVAILFIQGKVWGVILFLVSNIVAFKNIKKISLRSICFGLFTTSYGGWLFLTDMLDRYAFAGIVSGLILSIYYPKLLKYWIVLSSIYWVNLYRGWWFPIQLNWLKSSLEWNNYSVGLWLSLGNLILYLRMIWVYICEEKNEK